MHIEKNEKVMDCKRVVISGKGGAEVGEQAFDTFNYVVSGDDLVHKVKQIVHEGNIRRIIVKTEGGNTRARVSTLDRRGWGGSTADVGRAWRRGCVDNRLHPCRGESGRVKGGLHYVLSRDAEL